VTTQTTQILPHFKEYRGNETKNKKTKNKKQKNKKLQKILRGP